MRSAAQAELLREVRRYLWWEKPEEVIRRPERVIAQHLAAVLGLDPLRDALRNAEPGWFNERSWTYWCYRLGLAAPGDAVPDPPRRVF